MLITFAAALILKKYFAEAAPLPNGSDILSEAPIFSRDDSGSTSVDDCHGRTVWNILWSCLATTFACTWLSVHPNVSFKNEGKWEALARRVFLMLFSVLAPEVMVMWAFKQWRGAVMIRETVNTAHPGPRMHFFQSVLIVYDKCRSHRATMDQHTRALCADGRIPGFDDR